MENVRTKRWNLERVYPGDGGSTIKEQIHDIKLHIDQTQLELENHTHEDITEVAEMVERVQGLYTKVFELDEYIICRLAENVHDSKARVLSEESSQMKAQMETLLLAFRHYLARILDEKWNELLQQSEVAGIETFLIEQRQKVKDQLQPELEKVIHSLSVHGFEGWEDHYEQEFASLTVPVSNEEGTEEISFDRAFMRAMLSTNRATRQAIAASITEVYRENEERFASIFNHFVGYRNELYSLRGWSNPLTEMLEQNRIGEASIKSMMKTLHEHKSLLHQFLERKAQLNQLDKLNWYDIYAPTFTSKTTLTYKEAANIVITQFYKYSDKLGKFAEHAFEEGWIDPEPSDSKRQGAFCASLPSSKESRVMLSFTGNYQDVVTMAHELGHAYHNSFLQEEPGFSHNVGTGLAETASTFAENLVLDAAIDSAATQEDRLSLLEMKITNGLKYITYIPAKFEFEQQFYEQRRSQSLSAAELNDLMIKTEKDWFQDAVGEVDAHNWMTMPHFFNTEKAFYNIPYTIGYLFSNGIYSLYLQDKQTFTNRYDELLKHSGNQTMEDLGHQFLNQDLTSSAFWEAAVQPLEEAIHTYLAETKAYT
ncbi:M3 family oligoendopeptidase [Thalassobacillus sp. CUG 92003]|uniref:M3 family oligoendopeptidase n=1 Tax=Thalassobacillus sp. CUG 92003 TaxID=2736641 RepID=UPI0015E6A01B|nr:M3 family oligoendopeptidase [Thalassobacillus sp. CUG 92003]